MKFLIIIPAKDAATHLDRSLGSVLLQEGDFELLVHVQDAVSDDSTPQVIERWQNWLSSARRENVHLTFASEPDAGLYDGITKAYEANAPRRGVMTWLGSDDVLMPGALATVQSVMTDLPQVRWLTGLSLVAVEDCSNRSPWPLQKLSRRNIASGYHDGRTLGFIMQEGTFWYTELWDRVDGVDPSYRLASDWHLWVKFATETPLYTVDFPLGRYSFRKGQLAGDKTAYYKEVDDILSKQSRILIDDNRVLKVYRHYGAEKWAIEETYIEPVAVKRGPQVHNKMSAKEYLASLAGVELSPD